MLGTTLAELLEKRKYASSVEELEASLRGSGLDRAALERLAKHVNTPTAKEGATFKTVSPEGDETITSTVRAVVGDITCLYTDLTFHGYRLLG